MFILRGLKRLVFLVVFVVLGYLAAHYPVNGQPLYKVARQFFTSQGFEQGMKDLKMFLGSFLKSVGEEIQEDVTEADRKQLDSLIEKQMEETKK